MRCLKADAINAYSVVTNSVDKQDVWLKMHSAEGFATVQGTGELARLLKLYRSASLDLIEAMMRNPELENVANAHTKKKVRTLTNRLS